MLDNGFELTKSIDIMSNDRHDDIHPYVDMGSLSLARYAATSAQSRMERVSKISILLHASPVT